MAKKVHKGKDGGQVIELTEEDAKKLHEEMEEEKRNTDHIPCDKCRGRILHRKQKDGKWKCERCGKKISELDRSLQKGCDWYDMKEKFNEAEDKFFGKYKL